MKTLVANFSVEFGKTAEIAKAFAEAAGAELFEIVSKEPYTKKDLRYTNPLARCNVEKIRKKDVPVAGKVPNWDDYDTIFIGFPIWYGCAPNVVNTFCKDYDWINRKVYAFATSGGSGIGKTAENLKPYVKGAPVIKAKLTQTVDQLKSWAKELL